MATITVRNLDDDLVARLKARAEANQRSLEAEVRALLEDVAGRKPKAQLLAEADAIAAMTRGRVQGDSTELIREDRDR